MGDYIYKTTPALVRPDATIKLDTGEVIHVAVAGYKYAYKPYWDEKLNKKPEAQYIAPARRAFAKAGISVPRYGVAISETASGPAVGDRVFRTNASVAMNDYYFDRRGVIINLDGSDVDRRTLAQLLDPAHYGGYSAALADYIGDIIMHDYGYGRTVHTGDITPQIEAWRAKLDPMHRSMFEDLERTR